MLSLILRLSEPYVLAAAVVPSVKRTFGLLESTCLLVSVTPAGFSPEVISALVADSLAVPGLLEIPVLLEFDIPPSLLLREGALFTVRDEGEVKPERELALCLSEELALDMVCGVLEPDLEEDAGTDLDVWG